MRYVTVTAEELGHVRDGLKVIETLNEFGEPLVELYFYGLTDNPTALDVVKESISYWSDEEIPEQDVKVSEAVFVIPASVDTLYYLTGSGLKLSKGDEAIYSSGAEGPRTVSMHPRTLLNVAAGYFKVMALSRDEFSAEDFLLKYGIKARQVAPQVEQRTAPATTPEVPTGREGVAPAKRSSLGFNVEEWLG